jgi:hypothetical protein
MMISTRMITLMNLLKSRRSQWPYCLRRGSTAFRLVGLWVRIPPGAWLSLLSVCQIEVSATGLITLEESYRVWCVWVWSWSLDNEEARGCWTLTNFHSHFFCINLWCSRKIMCQTESFIIFWVLSNHITIRHWYRHMPRVRFYCYGLNKAFGLTWWPLVSSCNEKQEQNKNNLKLLVFDSIKGTNWTTARRYKNSSNWAKTKIRKSINRTTTAKNINRENVRSDINIK